MDGMTARRGPIFEENSKSPGLARLLCHGAQKM